jgi:hypothetical protein
MEITAKINRQKRTITITMPLQKAMPSKSSGKTLVVATTHCCQTTEARHSGRPIVLTANAFIYAASQTKKKKRKVARPSRTVQVQDTVAGAMAAYRAGKDRI